MVNAVVHGIRRNMSYDSSAFVLPASEDAEVGCVGISGAVGLAEDPSMASIACRQRGPIVLSDALKRQLVKETEDGGVKVFKERTSAIFKTVQVTRLFDAARDTLVYLIWSDKVIEGSPNNSLSVVVIQPWGAPR